MSCPVVQRRAGSILHDAAHLVHGLQSHRGEAHGDRLGDQGLYVS